jgi:glutathione peroxidase
MTSSLHQFSVKRIDGTPTSLKDYRGKVLLVVNVASQCGLTPQYAALEKLYEAHRERGLEVLGFPANEFGAQEPGSNGDIEEFCRSKFGIKFPMFEKIVVKGAGIHPLYAFLTQAQAQASSPNGALFEDKLNAYGVTRADPNDILWNFEKFLIGRDGTVLARFNPDVAPEHPALVQAIEAALADGT